MAQQKTVELIEKKLNIILESYQNEWNWRRIRDSKYPNQSWVIKKLRMNNEAYGSKGSPDTTTSPNSKTKNK